MLEGVIWILLAGFLAGQIARRAALPPLVGMILCGIFLGPQFMNRLGSEVLDSAEAFRTIAVMVILMKAGLGLDKEKLSQQGTVALRLGFLPGACEAVAIAFLSTWLLNFSFPAGLLLGCIIGAESPAVIVPGMLKLKSLGWGVKKGIPDAILTGSALSDVLLLLVFSLLLAFLSPGSMGDATDLVLPGGFTLNAVGQLPFKVVFQILLGLALGWVAARLLVRLLARGRWTQNAVQDSLVAASLALLLVVTAQNMPVFSGYLAVMSAGFFLNQLDAPLARRLRGGFNSLWTVAEIVLFVLLGASIQLAVLENVLLVGGLILIVGTCLGRSLGWYLSTLGSNWTPKERLFLLPGNSAKATVQAAIGAVPLAAGIEGGETILAISALSILITAPLGAWAIPAFAPKLLQKDAVDPTKVAIARQIISIAAVDTSRSAARVLATAADLARRSDGEVIVACVVDSHAPGEAMQQLQQKTERLLADIRHQFVVLEGVPSTEIVRLATKYNASEIVIAQGSRQTDRFSTKESVLQEVLAMSNCPVLLVTNT